MTISAVVTETNINASVTQLSNSVSVTDTNINASVSQTPISVSVSSSTINTSVDSATPVSVVVSQTVISASVSGGGGGGVTDHAALTSLDYASAGHTGFQASLTADVDYLTPATAALTYEPLLGFAPPPNTRLISTSAPLSGGGDLSADRSLSIALAGAAQDGYLSSVDWNTFNNKQSSISFPLAANLGGTGVANGVGSTLTLASATSITGGGTLALGGFTLTVPATGTAALLATANIFTSAQTVNANSTTALLVEQNGVKDNVLIVDTTNGRVGINTAPGAYELDIHGNMRTCFGRMYTISSSNVPFFTTGAGIVTMRFTTQGQTSNSFGLAIYYANVGIGTVTPNAKLEVVGHADAVQMIVQAYSSQTKDLQQWQNSAGTILAEINAGGNLFISVKSGATQAAAGAASGEIWKTASHVSLPDNVLMIGV